MAATQSASLLKSIFAGLGRRVVLSIAYDKDAFGISAAPAAFAAQTFGFSSAKLFQRRV